MHVLDDRTCDRAFVEVFRESINDSTAILLEFLELERADIGIVAHERRDDNAILFRTHRKIHFEQFDRKKSNGTIGFRRRIELAHVGRIDFQIAHVPDFSANRAPTIRKDRCDQRRDEFLLAAIEIDDGIIRAAPSCV